MNCLIPVITDHGDAESDEGNVKCRCSQKIDILSTIMNVVYLVMFFIFMFFSQRMQAVLMTLRYLKL